MRPKNTNASDVQYDFSGFERDDDERDGGVRSETHPDTQRALDELFEMIGEEV